MNLSEVLIFSLLTHSQLSRVQREVCLLLSAVPISALVAAAFLVCGAGGRECALGTEARCKVSQTGRT